jgi:transposase-like protein
VDRRFSVREDKDISTKRRYSAEFEKEAVRLMLIEGRPAREVADELGVARDLLYRKL